MKAEVAPNKVAIYVRWSTDEQTSGTTLEVQLQACRYYLQSKQWTPQDELIFIDDGYSGSTLDHPGLKKMREQIKAGAIDCVVVYKLDRLSRSIVDLVKLVLDEWQDSVRLQSVREPIDTATDFGRQVFVMLASFADWELSLIKRRMLSGRRARARAGRNAGTRRAYGYKTGTTPGAWIVEPTQAKIVQKIFSMYVDGYSASKIAQHLNDSGVRTGRNKMWSTRSILYVLDNDVYIGYVQFGSQSDNPIHVKSDSLPSIIDEQTFNRAKAKRQRTRRIASSKNAPGVNVRATRHKALVLGYAYCQCGQKLAIRSGGRADQKQYRYYICSSKTKEITSSCDRGGIQVHMLDDMVFKQVSAFVKQEYERARANETAITSAQEHYQIMLDTVEQIMMEARARLENVETQIKRIARDYTSNRLSAGAYVEAYEQIQKEKTQAIQAYNETHDEYKIQLTNYNGRTTINDFSKWLDEVKAWEHLDADAQRALLLQAVEYVIMDKTPGRNGKMGLRIKYSFEPPDWQM